MSDTDMTWQIWSLNAHTLQAEARLWPDESFPVSGDELANVKQLVGGGK